MTETAGSGASRFAVSKSRLEFLVDGIFAIAMTILVLELKVPEVGDRKSVVALGTALAHHLAGFVSYLLSFLMLGVFWFSHNRHYQHFTRITGLMLVLTLAQLAATAFFPFSAALLGRYPTNQLTLVIYLGCVLCYQLATLLVWVAASRSGVLAPQLGEPERRRLLKGNLGGCLGVGAIWLMHLIRIL